MIWAYSPHHFFIADLHKSQEQPDREAKMEIRLKKANLQP